MVRPTTRGKIKTPGHNCVVVLHFSIISIKLYYYYYIMALQFGNGNNFLKKISYACIKYKVVIQSARWLRWAYSIRAKKKKLSEVEFAKK